MSRQAETPREQSWRGIRQSVNTRTMTRQGRRRLGSKVLRTTFTLLVLGTLAGLGAYLWHGFERPAETLAPVVRSEPVREVVVLTNGVLPQDWVRDRLVLPAGIALVAVDLDAAKAALEGEGQVRVAVVSRDFPDTLVVTIEERAPVARVLAALSRGGPPEPLLVAGDGVVYRGFNYDAAMFTKLPWIDGIRLRRLGGGFEPVEGMEKVRDLILAVRQEAPHFADRFSIVSLAQLPLLVVRMPEVREVVFEPGGFRRQLARLDYILEFHARQPDAPRIERIDLSVEAQVSVKYAGRDGTGVASNPYPFTLNLNHPPNRTNNRGLQR